MPKRSIYLLMSMIFFLSMIAVATESSAQKIEDHEACIAEKKVCIGRFCVLLKPLEAATPKIGSGEKVLVDLRPFGLNFAVASKDEPKGLYTWREAKKICEDKGMSLPTKDELGAMYCHANLFVDKSNKDYPQTDPGCKESGTSNSIKDLTKDWYWFSSEYRDGFTRVQDFDKGSQDWYVEGYYIMVRCVRRF